MTFSSIHRKLMLAETNTINVQAMKWRNSIANILYGELIVRSRHELHSKKELPFIKIKKNQHSLINYLDHAPSSSSSYYYRYYQIYRLLLIGLLSEGLCLYMNRYYYTHRYTHSKSYVLIHCCITFQVCFGVKHKANLKTIKVIEDIINQ